MTTLYTDNFESYTDDTSPSGWLGPWKVRDIAQYAISGTKSMLMPGGTDGSPGKYTGIAARTSVDYRYKQKASFSGAVLLLHLLAHGDRSDSAEYHNGYRFMFTASASSVTADLKRYISDNWDSSPVASQTKSWTVAAGDIIVTRFQVDGTSVKLWIWNETNESEPTTPLVSYTDSTQRSAGYFTVHINNAGATVLTGFDDVTISDVSAGGASASFTIISGDATFSGGATVSPMTSFTLTAEDATFSGAASVGASSAVFSLTTGNSTFSGAAVGNTSQGTITTPALKNNTGTVLASETGITAYVYTPSTGALVVKLTGQTTNGSGVMAITDAAISAGTQYRVVIVLGSGAEGMDKLTAS